MKKTDSASITKSQPAVVRRIIASAVIKVLADVGIGRLTHRAVARTAKTSLSATTYYYATKMDMLHEASRQLMDSYLSRFRSIAHDFRNGKRASSTFEIFSTTLAVNAAEAHRGTTTAWYEIIMNSPRSSEGIQMASEWYSELLSIWMDLADAMGERKNPSDVQNAIDQVVGFQLMAIALGLTEQQIRSVSSGADPIVAWHLSDGQMSATAAPPQKSQDSRARILQTAIDLLIEEGAGSVSYRKIAERTGAAQSAPAYYFGSISGLLSAAQVELFHSSKTRYRTQMAFKPNQKPSISDIANLTTAIAIREATEFRLNSIAHYSLWIEAGRSRSLRADVQLAVRDQILAWKRRLTQVMPASNNIALYFQALFIGQLIRLTATGAEIANLSDIRHLYMQSLTAKRQMLLTDGSS